MTTSVVRPFNQKLRIAGLRICGLALLPVLIVTGPGWDGLPAVLLHMAGVLCVIACVLGRFWAILYIGGHKNRTIMQEGPYSICRHPLYLFSTIGAFGFGLLLDSVLMALLIGGTVFLILSATAAREEQDLRRMFGAAYDRYAEGVPRLLPRLGGFHTVRMVTVDVFALTRNWRDALVFLSLIPLAEVLNWMHATLIPVRLALW